MSLNKIYGFLALVLSFSFFLSVWGRFPLCSKEGFSRQYILRWALKCGQVADKSWIFLCMCIYVCLWVHVKARGQCRVSFSVAVPLSYFVTGSPTQSRTPYLAILIGQQAPEVLPNAGVMDTCPCAQLYMGTKDWTEAPMLEQQFTNWQIPSIHKLDFLKMRNNLIK